VLLPTRKHSLACGTVLLGKGRVNMAKAKVIRVPKADQPIYDTLSQAFRNGDIYSFSFDGSSWLTWDAQHDWEGTYRKNAEGRKVKRCECEDTCPFGPITWDRDELVSFLGLAPKGRLSKMQLVAQLRAIPHLPPAVLALLDAA